MKMPQSNSGYEIVSFVLTGEETVPARFSKTNEDIKCFYGMCIGRNTNPMVHDTYVVWHCGYNSADDEWTFWSGDYFKDWHKAIDNFAYRDEPSGQ